MATFSWVRKLGTANTWQTAQTKALITSLNAGQSIVRNHVSWGFGGSTSAWLNPTSQQGNLMAFGLVTTIGNGTESPPNPLTSPGNASPPSQRFMWWAVRAPVVVAWDSANPTVIWQSSLPEEEGDSQGQVLAPSGMGTGNTLNLWATWAPFAAWDATGTAILWYRVSTLVRTPL